ncbi:polyhomeotic-like protein 1 isoform X2 [Festucalex cinctus]
MDVSEDPNTSTNNNNNTTTATTTTTTTTTNGNTQTSRASRPPQIAHMSLYERQAVQALQALQRQPNAAQYFQQLMLQQQINNAQLQNLAAVQQATLAASRQSNTPSSSISQATTTVNLSTTSAGGTAVTPRPHGPATSATTTALNQSVLLAGNSPAQGQMYLRVNRSLRAPLASQLIFMPGGTATATVTTVAQTQQQQQQQQTETPTSASTQSDSDQVQNLALHCVSTPRAVAVKSELPERKEPGAFPLAQQQQAQPQQQAAKMSGNVKGSNQPAMTIPPPAASVAPSAASSPALPLSQILLSPSAAPVILVPTSNVPTSTQGYSIGSVAPKANVNTQTLVVQPLQQANAADKGPVPIQPKMAHGHRLPMQVTPRQPLPILPAPPSNSQAAHNPPHIPVQLVGARQCVAGSVQAVALAQVRNVAAQESAGAGVASHNTSTTVNKPANGSLKRKSDCDAPNEATAGSSESAPMKDAAAALTPAPTKESGALPAASFSLPPALSLPLPLSRAGHGDKERAPLPQAVVKPQVLTHLIEGFVIQEGAEPFPVTGLLKDRDFALGARAENGPPLLKCEYCLSLAPANQVRGSKRFCSNTCAKRYSVSYRGKGNSMASAPLQPAGENAARRRGPPRRSSANGNILVGQHLNVKCRSDSSRSEDASSDGDEEEEEEEEDTPSLSPSSSHSRSCSRAEQDNAPQSDAASAPGGLPMETAGFLSATPAQWSVEEVCRFISSLQGCEELAAHFLSQEIDGQALMLLREDHLISTMNIKLGPALKICASINSLRE